MPMARGFDVLRLVAANPLPSASAVRQRFRPDAIALVKNEDLLDAAYSYRIVPLEQPVGPTMRLEGEQFDAPMLLPASGELTALACCVCTVGSKLSQRSTALFGERKPSLALALDDLANELLFAVARRAQDRILADCMRRGLTASGELNAGDPGLSITAHEAVVKLSWAHAIGVKLNHGEQLVPLKSTTMIMGVGHDLPRSVFSRCELCPSRFKCTLKHTTEGLSAFAG
ncbi:MAG: hypothetical protein H6978_05270 [Gammaproteobacteria bacterium]|nr:hypothetical protein [Gammaproteobacteria bacterium]